MFRKPALGVLGLVWRSIEFRARGGIGLEGDEETPLDAIRTLKNFTSRRSIRCRGDLWFFVARISTFVALIAALAVLIQGHDGELMHVLATCLAVGAVAGLLTAPIFREFGEMYLDLWKSTQTLRELAAKDQQTGLLNNRSFIATVDDRLGLGRHVALLLGDLDRFKSINDRYGHLTGDEVIAAVGETLRDIFDDIAVLGRMGGEEYAVMIECPFSDVEMAHAHAGALAEEMRRRIAGITVPTSTDTLHPTISIGIAWSRGGKCFSDLYSRADKALYVAKAAGRDRVVAEHDIEVFDPETVLARRQDLFWRPAASTDDDIVEVEARLSA